MKLTEGQYYGKINKTLNINGLILSKTSYTKINLLPSHIHKNPYFCFITNGSYVEYNAQDKMFCNNGDIIFHPDFSEHTNEFYSNSTSCLNIEFSNQWITRLNELKLNIIPFTKSNDYYLQNLLQKINYELNNYDDTSDLMIEGIIYEFLASLQRKRVKSASVQKYLIAAKDYMDSRYSNNLSLNQIAKEVNLTPEHLAREFKKEFKVTIGQYIRALKVNKALHSLTNTNKSLIEIALEGGFSDQSHFIRVFKKHIGVTPIHLRQKK